MGAQRLPGAPGIVPHTPSQREVELVDELTRLTDKMDRDMTATREFIDAMKMVWVTIDMHHRQTEIELANLGAAIRKLEVYFEWQTQHGGPHVGHHI